MTPATNIHPLGSFEGPNDNSWRSSPCTAPLAAHEPQEGAGGREGRIQVQLCSAFLPALTQKLPPERIPVSMLLILGLCFPTPTDLETQPAASQQLKCFLMASTQRFTLSQLALKPIHKNAFCKQICFIIVGPGKCLK